jgi:hypothetical protein
MLSKLRASFIGVIFCLCDGMQLLDWLGSSVDLCGLAMCCMKGKDAKSMTIKLAEGLDVGRESVRVKNIILDHAFVFLWVNCLEPCKTLLCDLTYPQL